MQERVFPKPPEPPAAPISGKPPPTSWFDQNVVRYFQIKSESELLQDILLLADALQTDQIVKGRGPQLKKAPFPERATPEEATTITSFNTLQPYMKAEIQSLERMIIVLKGEAPPELLVRLNGDLAALQQMARSFPNLSQAQIDKLNTLPAKLVELARRAPLATRQEFWEEFVRLYELLMRHNDGALRAFKEAKAARAIYQLLTTLSTPAQVKELTTLIQNMAKTNPEVLNFLADLKGKKGSVASFIAHAFIAEQLKEQIAANPNITPGEIKKLIEKAYNKMFPPTVPFLVQVRETIEETVAQANFPYGKSATGVSFAEDKKGKVAPNDAFDQEHAAAFSLDATSSKMISGATSQLDGMSGSLPALENMQTKFGQGAAVSSHESLSSGSLPDEFKNIILNIYMPGQQKYLMSLAEILFFTNFGAEMGNTLLNLILGFGEAANHYDFSNFLHKQNSYFSGDYNTAKNQLANELQQADIDLGKITAALNKINQEANSIENNPQLTPGQKKALLTQLQGYARNLEVTQGSLTNLKSFLGGLQVVPVTDGHGDTVPNEFNVVGTSTNDPNWQTTLNGDENTVINGNTSGDPPGGLLHIQSIIQTDQSDYTNQGTRQQMVLQMRMTEIQQEWTVVSSALQLLNQSYMTVAQGIYK